MSSKYIKIVKIVKENWKKYNVFLNFERVRGESTLGENQPKFLIWKIPQKIDFLPQKIHSILSCFIFHFMLYLCILKDIK